MKGYRTSEKSPTSAQIITKICKAMAEMQVMEASAGKSGTPTDSGVE